MIEERERERERRPLFFPPLKVLFLFLLFFAPMPSIFSTKKTRALLKVQKKRGCSHLRGLFRGAPFFKNFFFGISAQFSLPLLFFLPLFERENSRTTNTMSSNYFGNDGATQFQGGGYGGYARARAKRLSFSFSLFLSLSLSLSFYALLSFFFFFFFFFFFSR